MADAIKRVTLVSVVTMVLLILPGVASAHVTTGDLAILSVTASTTRAHVGDVLRLTAVAEDLGPDAVSSSFDITYNETPTLALRGERCIGAGNPSPDTPTCEFGPVDTGVALTTRVRTKVVATGDKSVVAEFCVSQEATDFVDPNPANDCGSVTVKVLGRR
jgi:hypothetical protein